MSTKFSSCVASSHIYIVSMATAAIWPSCEPQSMLTDSHLEDFRRLLWKTTQDHMDSSTLNLISYPNSTLSNIKVVLVRPHSAFACNAIIREAEAERPQARIHRNPVFKKKVTAELPACRGQAPSMVSFAPFLSTPLSSAETLLLWHHCWLSVVKGIPWGVGGVARKAKTCHSE